MDFLRQKDKKWLNLTKESWDMEFIINQLSREVERNKLWRPWVVAMIVQFSAKTDT